MSGDDTVPYILGEILVVMNRIHRDIIKVLNKEDQGWRVRGVSPKRLPADDQDWSVAMRAVIMRLEAATDGMKKAEVAEYLEKNGHERVSHKMKTSKGKKTPNPLNTMAESGVIIRLRRGPSHGGDLYFSRENYLRRFSSLTDEAQAVAVSDKLQLEEKEKNNEHSSTQHPGHADDGGGGGPVGAVRDQDEGAGAGTDVALPIGRPTPDDRRAGLPHYRGPTFLESGRDVGEVPTGGRKGRMGKHGRR